MNYLKYVNLINSNNSLNLFLQGGFALKYVKDKIMIISFILFLIVGGFTFNFYNNLSTMLKKICLISTIILLVIVLISMISKRERK